MLDKHVVTRRAVRGWPDSGHRPFSNFAAVHRIIAAASVAILAGPTGYLLVALARHEGPPPTTARLLAAAMVAGPLVGAVLLLFGVGARSTGRALPADTADTAALAERVARAEAALAREQERLHQLRATVTGITFSHQLLNDGGGDLHDDDRARLSTMHDRELDRLQRLISPSHGDDQVAAVDLQGIVDEMLVPLRARGLRVRWEGTACWAFARPDAVAEVVQVLLENAVAHGGARDVAVEVEARAGRVRLRVSDHGPGVPRALARRVFDRGVRGDRSTGEGLGLHIAQTLAAEAGGHLSLDDDPGRPGSCFVLELAGYDPEVSSCLVASD